MMYCSRPTCIGYNTILVAYGLYINTAKIFSIYIFLSKTCWLLNMNTNNPNSCWKPVQLLLFALQDLIFCGWKPDPFASLLYNPLKYLMEYSEHWRCMYPNSSSILLWNPGFRQYRSNTFIFCTDDRTSPRVSKSAPKKAVTQLHHILLLKSK